MTPVLSDAFWAKVDKSAPGGCWLWTAAKNSRGYGQIRINQKLYYAHRLALADSRVDIPPRHDVDHICHVRLCVNPEHLRVATRSQNMQNHSGAQTNSKSGVRGVHWSPEYRQWRVQVKLNGKVQVSRSFTSLDEAEAAAIAIRNQLFTHNEIDRQATS